MQQRHNQNIHHTDGYDHDPNTVSVHDDLTGEISKTKVK